MLTSVEPTIFPTLVLHTPGSEYIVYALSITNVSTSSHVGFCHARIKFWDAAYVNHDNAIIGASTISSLCIRPISLPVLQDLYDGWAWHPREGSSAERVHHEVEYFSSGDEKYLDFDIHVHYGPPPSARMPGGRKPPGGSSYSYTYNDADVDILADDDGSQASEPGANAVTEW